MSANIGNVLSQPAFRHLNARVSDALAPSRTPPPVPSQIIPQKVKIFFAERTTRVFGIAAVYLVSSTETKIETASTIMPASENEIKENPANATDKTDAPSITYQMMLVSVLFALSARFLIVLDGQEKECGIMSKLSSIHCSDACRRFSAASHLKAIQTACQNLLLENSRVLQEIKSRFIALFLVSVILITKVNAVRSI
jgi:hypothetical protein